MTARRQTGRRRSKTNKNAKPPPPENLNIKRQNQEAGTEDSTDSEKRLNGGNKEMLKLQLYKNRLRNPAEGLSAKIEFQQLQKNGGTVKFM